MKSLVELLVHVLQDCGAKCGADPSRDVITVTRRTINEGDSFLTITLPTFAQGFERALERGCLSPALFPKFKFGKGTCRPRFLGGFMERIFDPDGVLLAKVSPDCILAVRQICLLVKKLKLPCTAERERAAELAFANIESELRSHVYPNGTLDAFSRVSRVVLGSVLGRCSDELRFSQYVPRHGPGTTQEAVRGNAKFRFTSWSSRVETVFPYTEFGIGSIRNIDEWLDRFPVSFLSARDELPVRVVFVPKTQKTPRVIAIEPVQMQYLQQGIADWLVKRIEHSSDITAGRVNFSDQSINARLSLTSSADGSYATIDLSEASDRVSSILVGRMLSSFPNFRREVFACRSSRAMLPSGNIIPLRKFASMGSALCFPMESLVFFNAIVTIRILEAGVRITPRAVRKYSKGVYVYGDDIVVPVDEAPLICEKLSDFGLKVNAHKSFWTGKFRESCGVDAYDGVNVTPVYVRRLFPTSGTDAHGVLSTVALANQLYMAGLWRTSRALRLLVEKLVGVLPSISSDSSTILNKMMDDPRKFVKKYATIGWVSFSNAVSHNGWDKNLQTLKFKGLVASPVQREDPLGDDPALLKCFALIGNSDVDPEHLTRTVRYGNLALKRRWITL